MKKDFEIKLPSSYTAITVENIWKAIECIAKTGKVFNKAQLLQNGLTPKNDDGVGRILSYLKFLDFIEEERDKDHEPKFRVKQSSKVTDVLYELKAGRKDAALQKLKEHMLTHQLYTSLVEVFFRNEQTKTFSELEHFLKENQPGKTPDYYQKGGAFVMKLLEFAQLVSVNGNDITLTTEGKTEVSEAETDELKADESEGKEQQKALTRLADKQNGEYVPFQEEKLAILKYNVRIITPNSNHEIELKDSDDVEIAILLLNKIKKEIANGKLQETTGG